MVEQILDNAIKVLIIPFASFLLLQLKAYITRRAEESKVKQHLGILRELIEAAVESANQKQVDHLKQNGEWTEAKQAEIFQGVKRIVMAQLTTETQKVLSGAYVNLEQFIDLKIERTVRRSKNG